MLSESDFETRARYRRQIARRDETIARLRRSLEYIQRHVEAIAGHTTARYSESWRIADRALNAKDDDSGAAAGGTTCDL